MPGRALVCQSRPGRTVHRRGSSHVQCTLYSSPVMSNRSEIQFVRFNTNLKLQTLAQCRKFIGFIIVIDREGQMANYSECGHPGMATIRYHSAYEIRTLFA